MTLLQNRQASPTSPPDTSDFEGAGDCGTVIKKKLVQTTQLFGDRPDPVPLRNVRKNNNKKQKKKEVGVQCLRLCPLVPLVRIYEQELVG